MNDHVPTVYVLMDKVGLVKYLLFCHFYILHVQAMHRLEDHGIVLNECFFDIWRNKGLAYSHKDGLACVMVSNSRLDKVAFHVDYLQGKEEKQVRN